MSDVSEWWSTNIIEMEPGSISLRGMPIENLIGNKSFVEMIWLMTTGDQINKKKSAYKLCSFHKFSIYGIWSPK